MSLKSLVKQVVGSSTFILVAVYLATFATAASRESEERVKDPQIKKDIQIKINELFVSSSAELGEIIEIKLPVFRNYRLFRISVYDERLLQHRVCPGGESFGMFAYGKEKLLYLPHNNNLEEILWQEQQDRPTKLEPDILAFVLSLSKLSNKNYFADVVKSSNDILSYEQRGGYTVNKGKLPKYAVNIVAPYWRDQGTTNDLIFYALSGWNDQTQELAKITASFDKFSPKLSLKKFILETSVFEDIRSPIC